MTDGARTTFMEKHAVKRAAERYGADAHLVDRVRRLIRRAMRERARSRAPGAIRPHVKEAVRIRGLGKNREMWRVEIDGQFYRVVYDVPRKVVVTFLPLE
jgi:hypothetical protein